MKPKTIRTQNSLHIILFFMFLYSSNIRAIEKNNRWKINPSGSISWIIANNVPHSDYIEMSGDSISAILKYKVDEDKSFHLDRLLVWPMLRTIPNNTHAIFIRTVSEDVLKNVNIDGKPLRKEKVQEIILNGLMTIKSLFDKVSVQRVLFPSTKSPAFLEEYKLTNQQDKTVSIEIPNINISTVSAPEKGVDGSYIVRSKSSGSGFFLLNQGESVSFGLIISAQQLNKNSFIC